MRSLSSPRRSSLALRVLTAAALALALQVAVPASAVPSSPDAGHGQPATCERRGVGQADARGQEHGAPPHCAGPNAASVLYFQDLHEIMPVAQADGERGGVARLATVIEEQRELRPSAVAFSGDMAGGTLFGGIYHGLPMVDALNEIGVDVGSFGQHDFDAGAENALGMVEASGFPWVSSNLTYADGAPFLPGFPTHVERVNGIDIGFFGLTGAMETTTTVGQVLERNHLEAAREAVAELEAAGADVIVALTQIPLDANIALLEAVPEVSAAFREENSFVSPSQVVTLDDGRLILAPEGNYGSVLRLDIERHGQSYALSYDEIQVDETVAEDPELAALAQRYQDELEERLSTRIATAPQHLDRAAVRLITADAFRAHHQADLAIFNSGGARADIPGPEVTLRDAYSVLPFGNISVVIEISGHQLETALEQASGAMVPSGFTFRFDGGATGAARVTDLRLADGTAVDPAGTYTVATNQFIVNTNPVVAGTPTSGGVLDVETLIAYATEVGTLVAPEPRVFG